MNQSESDMYGLGSAQAIHLLLTIADESNLLVETRSPHGIPRSGKFGKVLGSR